jgi:ATP-independent RNA helicase DbpA
MNPIPETAPAIAADLSFASLPLAPTTLTNLEQLGYRQMTPIQAASLPRRWPART